MTYSLNPLFVPDDDSNPYETALSAQLTVAAIRQHRMGSARQRQFWEPVLAKVEDEIAGMLGDIRAGRSAATRSARIDEIYATELKELAKANGKTGASPIAEAMVYLIKVRTQPAEAEVKYMAAGPWLMIQVFQNDEPDWDHRAWKTAPADGGVSVGQLTRFAVKWDDGRVRNGTVEIRDTKQKTLVVSKSRGFAWE